MTVLRHLPVVLVVLVVAGALAFVVAQLASASALPRGPLEPVWDRDVCAHCRMHLGEPGFAAQVQTAGGDVLWFDDPGCTFLHLADAEPEVHATYFHHLREERWIPAGDAAFVSVPHSPMGFGLGAVDAGTPDAVPLAEARRRALAKVGAGTGEERR